GAGEVQGLHLADELRMRGLEDRPLAREVIDLPAEHVAEEAGRLVVEVVTGGQDIELACGCRVEDVPLEGATGRAGGATRAGGDVGYRQARSLGREGDHAQRQVALAGARPPPRPRA